jgi:hypothetical protein
MAAKYASIVAERPKRAASAASRTYPARATPSVNRLTMPTVRPRRAGVDEDVEFELENLGMGFYLFPLEKTIVLLPTPVC